MVAKSLMGQGAVASLSLGTWGCLPGCSHSCEVFQKLLFRSDRRASSLHKASVRPLEWVLAAF